VALWLHPQDKVIGQDGQVPVGLGLACALDSVINVTRMQLIWELTSDACCMQVSNKGSGREENVLGVPWKSGNLGTAPSRLMSGSKPACLPVCIYCCGNGR
jgi:hypothetical protein